MQASRARVEIIRFGLLITMTLALVTVAHRATSNNHSGTSATGSHPSTSQSATTGSKAPSSSPTSTGSATNGGSAGGGGSSSGNGGGTANGGGSSSNGNGSSSGSGSTGGGVDVGPTLPRTGPSNVAILVGFGFVMIGGGALSLTWSRASARQRPSTPGMS